MPTDEERREVATRLRAKYKERMRPGYFEPQDVFMQSYDYLKDLESCVPDGASLFTVFADFIEPEPERTCRMVLDEDATSLLEYDEVFRCTACGEEVVRKTGATIRFCPMCRARVTDWVVPG